MFQRLKRDLNVVLLTLGFMAMATLYAQYAGYFTVDSRSPEAPQYDSASLSGLLDDVARHRRRR